METKIQQGHTKEWWINFNSGTVTVSGREVDGLYLVKWFCDDEFVGEFELGGGNWGAYPLRLGNWRIEFWQDNNKISEYNNTLKGNNILIIADFESKTPGKNLPIGKLINRGMEIEKEHGCEVIFYFKDSERYDLTPLKTLKMNDKYDFKLILEENYG